MMPHTPKYARVMSVIERRVREGDYLLRSIPGERTIADQVGVSYMTARRAVLELLRSRVLVRRDNGALEVHPEYVRRNIDSKVVLLHPDFPSPYLANLRIIVMRALEQRGLTLRPVHYVHWDDPVVADAVTNTGGVLVIPSTEPIPAWVLATLRSNKVVMLDGDSSRDGIPSIRLFPDRHIEHVLAHLKQLGHRRIDCVNAQQHNPEIDRRIEFWRTWLAEHDCSGSLRDNPAPSYADPTPFAHELISGLIDNQSLDATALVCTTFPSAIAATRAFWERGWQVGPDISICAMNIEHPARFVCPSITGLDMPDLSELLARCLKWFSEGDPPAALRRMGPPDPPMEPPDLLMEPLEPVLFVGESTSRPSTERRRAPAR